jgi:3-(3-hydroxy-phenyl)propionate hydroxylase
MSSPDTPAVDVIVVGRGPVGMTAALRLAALGVASTVIDSQPARSVNPGSKAVLIARQVIEITETLGVGGQIVAEGLAWTTGRVFVRGREVRATRLETPPGMLPEVVNLAQQRVEELLLERLRAEPLVTLIPDATVVRAAEDPGAGAARSRTDESAVIVTYQDPRGEHVIRARWLLGCDGARSTVRHELGIAFAGYGHDDHFLIADIAADLPFPPERQLHFDPPYNPGRTVLIHPQPDGTWHIDWQVGQEVDAAEEQANGGLDRRLRALVGDAPYQVRWVTTYRFKQLKAARFRHGHVFLAGDAAHLTSPYGARGMNSGIADAENIAWRLGLVLRGWSAPGLLDGYAPERDYAAAENLRITGRTAGFMCPRTPWQRFRQRTTLTAARYLPPAGRFVDSGKFYEPPAYPRSGSAATDHRDHAATTLGHVRAGVPVPDAPVVTSVPGVTRLGQLLRPGVAVLWFPASPAPDAARVAGHVIACLPPGFPIRVLTAAGPAGVTTDDGGAQAAGYVRIQGDGLRRAWFPQGVPAGGCFAVIRPDGYLAGIYSLARRDVADTMTAAVTDFFAITTTSHPASGTAKGSVA